MLRKFWIENKNGGLLSLVLCFMLWIPTMLQASSPEDDTYPTPERLFYIARSLNRNLVCYDANLKEGKLDLNTPVEVYWLNRTDRPGHTNGLNFIQRKLAYGYRWYSVRMMPARSFSVLMNVTSLFGKIKDAIRLLWIFRGHRPGWFRFM